MDMGKKRKGIATSTIIGVAAGSIGLIAVAVALTQVQGILEFFINNFWLVLGGVAFIGGVVVFVRNAGQQDPNWRQDIGGLLGIVVLLTLIIMLTPTVAGTLSEFEADLEFLVDNPIGEEPRLRGLEVSNFEDVGTFAVAAPEAPRTMATFRTLSLLGDDIQGDYTVTCDDEQVWSGSYSDSVVEGTDQDITKRLRNMPGGTQCEVTVTLESDETTGIIDEESTSFTTPTG